MSTLLFILISFLALAVAISLSLVRLRSAVREVPDVAFLHTFSPDRFRPMERILSNSDFAWASSQGLSSKELWKLRAERRKVFRVYLKNLVRDFNKLHYAARAILITSESDRPELAGKLIQMRVSFQRALWGVRLRLLLHEFGICEVKVSGLIQVAEEVRTEIRSLVHSGQTSAA